MNREIYRRIEEVIDHSSIVIGKVSKNELHFKLQHLLVRLAKEFEYEGIAEYPVYIEDKLKGFIDVAWIDDDEKPFLVMEIDARRKKWSIEKLKLVESLNKFWFCYAKGTAESAESMCDLYDKEKEILLIYRQFDTISQDNKDMTKEDEMKWEKWVIEADSLDKGPTNFHQNSLALH